MVLRYTAVRAGRLSAVLREDMGLSAGLMNRLKWAQRLLVNGEPRHTDYPVEAGDEITVLMEEPEPDYPSQDGPLTILYEDEHLLAVDKPAGMLIHPSRSKNTDTLANFVLGYYRRRGERGVFHPLTRLDRDTFGVVLLAKNAHIHALLQVTPVEKIYHALVLGGPEGEKGVIDAPIARKPLPSLLREVSSEGKPSVTEYEVLQRMEGITKLALRPITGRTHQLRVHCAYMGFPILGDPQYGTPECMAYAQSQLLCAKTLSLTHPVTHTPLELHSRLDAAL